MFVSRLGQSGRRSTRVGNQASLFLANMKQYGATHVLVPGKQSRPATPQQGVNKLSTTDRHEPVLAHATNTRLSAASADTSSNNMSTTQALSGARDPLETPFFTADPKLLRWTRRFTPSSTNTTDWKEALLSSATLMISRSEPPTTFFVTIP